MAKVLHLKNLLNGTGRFRRADDSALPATYRALLPFSHFTVYPKFQNVSRNFGWLEKEGRQEQRGKAVLQRNNGGGRHGGDGYRWSSRACGISVVANMTFADRQRGIRIGGMCGHDDTAHDMCQQQRHEEYSSPTATPVSEKHAESLW